MTKLDFLLTSPQNCKENSNDSKTITKERNMETRQATPFYHLNWS